MGTSASYIIRKARSTQNLWNICGQLKPIIIQHYLHSSYDICLYLRLIIFCFHFLP